METISKQFENISGVYSVTAPIEMTKTFVEVQQAVTKVGRGLVLVLMAVSIITVGTTIRLSVFARRWAACGRCSWVRLWCRWKMSGPPS